MVPLATAFARSGYRSIVFDMPGHGRSTGRESSLVEFLAAMRTRRGHARLAGLWSSATRSAAPPRSSASRSSVFPSAEPCSFRQHPARPTTSTASPGRSAFRMPRTDGMVRQLVERVGRSLESLDAVVAAEHATVPALVFHDPADREVPFEFSARMANAWRGSRLIEAPSLGHKRILRDPTVIARAVEFGVSLEPDVIPSGGRSPGGEESRSSRQRTFARRTFDTVDSQSSATQCSSRSASRASRR